MDAKELRLGNWAKGPMGEHMKVDILGHFQNPNYIHAYKDGEFGQNGYTGIELSPKILEACGFEKHPISMIPSEYWYVLGELSYNESHMGWWFRGSLNAPLQYLHQLQNLYYCLCGEELNIEL